MKPFRAFVVSQYYDNQSEYDSVGQTQPYTFEQYYLNNKSRLMQKYRDTRKPKFEYPSLMNDQQDAF